MLGPSTPKITREIWKYNNWNFSNLLINQKLRVFSGITFTISTSITNTITTYTTPDSDTYLIYSVIKEGIHTRERRSYGRSLHIRGYLRTESHIFLVWVIVDELKCESQWNWRPSFCDLTFSFMVFYLISLVVSRSFNAEFGNSKNRLRT